MNLGLLEGWATGGPAGSTPAAAAGALPVLAAADAAMDPAFRTLMDLFAVPAPVPVPGDLKVFPGVESRVLAWPSTLSRVAVTDTEALPAAPALESTDEDEQAVSELLAGLFACTELTPLDRTIARPEAPAVALATLPGRDDTADIRIPTAIPFVKPAAVEMPPQNAIELSQAPKQGRNNSAVEHTDAAAVTEPSGMSAGAMTIAGADLSDDREPSDSEQFRGEARKQAPLAPVRAGAGADTDRNAAIPELATTAGRMAVNTAGTDAPALFKAPLKAAAQSITFTAPFTHAAHAIAASRMQAAAAIQAPQAPASLPGTTAAQIVQTIQLAWFRHGGEARITLDPEQFGDLSVAIRVDRGVVVARLQADAPQVREWLHANVDTLRSALAEHQLRLDHLEIAATDDARESENREGGQRDGRESSSHPRRSRRYRPDQLFEIDA